MGLFSKKKHHTAGQVDENRLPRHIAVIMDGNGRWAKRRGLPRTAGHKVGAEVFRKIATYCKELGVEYLTVYAFSTENWKRPADEVNTIMGLLKQYMLEAIDSMERDQIRLRFLGDMSALSPELQELARLLERVGGGNASATELYQLQFLVGMLRVQATGGAKLSQQVNQGFESLLKQQG